MLPSVARVAFRGAAASRQGVAPQLGLRYLRSTPGATPPASDAAQEPEAAAPSSPPSPPSASAVPPSSSTEPGVETPSTPSSAPADPAAAPEQPVNALQNRSQSLAEAFLDLHPDVAPRTEEELNSKFPGDKTGAKARGQGKSSIEKKRANLARLLLGASVAGIGYGAWELGKEWENEEEQKKMFARSDDKEAVEQSQKEGLEGFWGRMKIRGLDHLDVRVLSPALNPC